MSTSSGKNEVCYLCGADQTTGVNSCWALKRPTRVFLFFCIFNFKGVIGVGGLRLEDMLEMDLKGVVGRH